MKESLKIWFKAVPEGWKFFGAVVGFGAIIWTAAVKIDHRKDKGLNQENVIEYLKQADIDRIRHERSKDSLNALQWNKLYARLDNVSDSLGLIFINQHTLTNAVGTIGSKVTNTVPELFKLMGGLQFELVQSEIMKSVFPETKIKIMNIDTTKK